MKYFDNCATTIVDDEVITAMNKIHKELFFNPSSLSASALQAKNLIEDSREIVAKCIGAQKSEILFTSGGSESNNTAIFGSLRNNKGKIITSKTEHASVFYTLNEMKNRGFDVVYAPLNSDGSVKTEKFEDLIDDETRLVALMHVNNETGAINDIAELCKKTKAKNKNCLFLCDGVQAFCKVPVNVKNLDVDFYSMSAHKIHGPKGIGALYIKNGVKISPLIFGGGQENNLRSGTENVAVPCETFGRLLPIAYERYIHPIFEYLCRIRGEDLQVGFQRVEIFAVRDRHTLAPCVAFAQRAVPCAEERGELEKYTFGRLHRRGRFQRILV